LQSMRDPRPYILLVTGRPEKYRRTTEKWLKERIHLWHQYTLFMRPDNDNTPDEILKKKIYTEQIRPFYDVQLVLDDRTKVVKMWRSLGLECWQVAEGDF
jgi:hypothetical protein